MNIRGFFVSLEGGEGCGKSTLQARLTAELESRGYRVLCTREPGGSRIGEEIRSVVLDARHAGLTDWTELFLMLASRAQLVREIVRPALDDGQIVLCDRYMDASAAYQGVARGLGIEQVEELNRLATGDLPPDLTLLVDLDPQEGRARLKGPRDRMEQEQSEFHRKVREGYLELSRRHADRYVVLDGSLSADRLGEEAWKVLSGRMLAGGGG